MIRTAHKMFLKRIARLIVAISVVATLTSVAHAQAGATLKGKVTLGGTGKPIHNVLVTLLQLKRTVNTDESGSYEFQNVPAGRYDVLAHLDRVPDVVQAVTLTAGSTTTADFQMELSAVQEQVTVTATGAEQSVSSSIQSVEVIGSVDLAKKSPVSLGEALDGELGVSKRSFGPGTARPVIRGFDGDRVLVLEDGNRVGGLGFQSGDHAEPVDVLNVERVEIVKGPATLLYGSNAIGGVVNTISGHDSAHPGLNGYITGIGSSNNHQFGGSGGVEYGKSNWLVWVNAGAQRAGDYHTPIGEVPNSFSRESSFSSGVGYYPNKGFLSFNYTLNKRRYGIPYDPNEEEPEVVFLNPRRQSFEVRGGYREARSFLEAGTFSVQYNNYEHSEIDAETGLPNTSFKNNSWLFNGTFDQQKRDRWSGKFGAWGQHRDFESIGDEALTPPTKQNSFALFALESLDFERIGIQFGARLENNAYSPAQTEQHGHLPDRDFIGLSAAFGVRIPTWTNGTLIANYSHSYRAPSLDELYNNGPHPGNLAFEIGNPDLKREAGDGLDFGVRHSSKRIRAEANGFFYNIRDFIFLGPTGDLDEESGLIVAEYLQGTTHFTGMEARADVALHPSVWLNLGMDYVRAELTDSNTPLPRIPPLRGRLGFEFRYKGLLLNPEIVMAKDQDRLFSNEDRTSGYTVFGLSGSYLFATGHAAHIVSFNAFNLGDRLYANHLSFIKDFAPEMGRGVRVTYTLRFF